MTIRERIEELEQDQRRELEDVYRLAEQAEQVQPLLLPEARRYSNYLDGFKHSELDEFGPEEVYVASESFLAHESVYLTELVERHEALLQDLRQAVDELPYCTDNKFIDGTVVRKDNLREKMEELVTTYEEDLQEVMEICSRTVPDDEIPDPFEIKSKRNRRRAQRESSPDSLLAVGRSAAGFFAD